MPLTTYKCHFSRVPVNDAGAKTLTHTHARIHEDIRTHAVDIKMAVTLLTANLLNLLHHFQVINYLQYFDYKVYRNTWTDYHLFFSDQRSNSKKKKKIQRITRKFSTKINLKNIAGP